MSANSDLFQNQSTLTVPRDPFLEKIVYNTALSKKDLRVALMLMTSLDGWNPDRSHKKADSCNFKQISIGKIAKELLLDKKEVKKCIELLLSEGILQQGDSDTAYDGYRFTF